MDPGFLALYRRGNYFRRDVVGVNEKEKERKREERERFAMAAIGFSLKYSPQFQKHFLNVACGIADPSKLKKIITVVEEKRWGDLQLMTMGGIYVIEGKIRAKLQAWQDFGKDEFWDDGGYGAAIKNAFKNDPRKRYYVVLGYSDRTLDQPKGEGIKCRQVSWECLERGFPESNYMASDLADCLSELGVNAFYLRKTKKMKIRTSLEEAAIGVEILSGTLKALGIRKGNVSDGSYYPDQQNWYFGTDLPMPRATEKKSSALVKLKDFVKPKSGDTIGWIGWEAMQAGNWRRSIWFYCGTEEIRRALENRFKRTLSKENVVSSASAEGETSKRYLCVSPLENSKVKSAPDQKWFLSVFEVLGLASK